MIDEQTQSLRAVAKLLELSDESIRIVDVGSNFVEGSPPYHALMQAGLCRVIGFEPQAETVTNSKHEMHLPFAIGDGREVDFRICAHSGWSSTFKPDSRTIGVFSQYAANVEVVGETRITTRRLDDVDEIDRIDLLKIDIQGGELAVFKNASQKLAGAVFIQTEVAYVPLYEGQPMLGELDLELRRLGFIPHCFASFKKAIIPPFRLGGSPWETLNQLLDGDMVYVRDFRDLSAMNVEQLKALAIIAHGCYGSWDLSYRVIQHLESGRQISPRSCESYLGIVNGLMARSADG